MKIALISVDSIIAHGIRSLSSFLRKHGHETTCIFMARWEFYLHLPLEELLQKDFSELLDLLNDFDLIGVSCGASYNQYFTEFLINRLKQLNKTIVLGGEHVSICPEECIEFADIICIGEGYDSLLELVNKLENNENIDNIPNLWLKKAGEVIKNPPRPLRQNLDILPTPDYDFSSQYLYNGENVIKHCPEHFTYLNYYSIYGCPHNCHFCGNLATFQAFNNSKDSEVIKLRMKSAHRVVEELEEILENFPHHKLEYIFFNDSTFFSRSYSDIEHFTKEYLQKIKVPLSFYVSPKTFNERKMEVLSKLPLYNIEMGIQSGSKRINNKFYNRIGETEKIVSFSKIMVKYQDRMMYPPKFDIIIDNPYDLKQDKIDTLELLVHQLAKPYWLTPSNLEFFPGTDLYNRALQDGYVVSLKEQIRHLNEDVSFFHNVNYEENLISIDNIIFFMGRINQDEFSGKFYTFLIESFLKRDYKDIPFKAKVIIPDNIQQTFKNYSGVISGEKLVQFKYLLKLVAFLSNFPVNKQSEFPEITVSLNNLIFTQNMLNDFYRSKTRKPSLQFS